MQPHDCGLQMSHIQPVCQLSQLARLFTLEHLRRYQNGLQGGVYQHDVEEEI